MFNKEAIDELSENLELNVETDVSKNKALDLHEFGKVQLQELKDFKKMRQDMVTKREAINRAIGFLDRRIEIALGALKTLQMPD